MNLDRMIAVRNDKIIYRDRDQCVKVFSPRYLKSEIMNEVKNQTLAEEAGIHVPPILEVTQINGKWAICYKYIAGKSLEQLMNENPDKKEEYINLLVDLQLLLHTKNIKVINQLRDQIEHRIEQTDLSAVIRYYLHTRLEELQNGDQLCHGDFVPSNIIIDEQGTPYIIDWSRAAHGNVMVDIARTYLLLWMKGQIDTAALYINRICKKKNIKEEEVLEWMPVIAAEQLSKCSDKEREFLLSWILFDHK